MIVKSSQLHQITNFLTDSRIGIRKMQENIKTGQSTRKITKMSKSFNFGNRFRTFEGQRKKPHPSRWSSSQNTF